MILTLLFSTAFLAAQENRGTTPEEQRQTIATAEDTGAGPATTMDSYQVMTQAGYDESSPAVVKIVSDAGRKIGNGIIVAANSEGIGFVLTSYSIVAGHDKVAVILKNHPDGLLGHYVERWVSFDLNLAIIAIKNFPGGQTMATFGRSKKASVDKVYTTVSHNEIGDWYPNPTSLISEDENYFTLNSSAFSELEGAPLMDKDGKIIAVVTSRNTPASNEGNFVSAIKSDAVTPLLDEWFQSIELSQKWQVKGFIVAPWMWVVGAGAAGGAITTVIATQGGDGGGAPRGLPGPPPVPDAVGQK
jgi:hypothetical protein